MSKQLAFSGHLQGSRFRRGVASGPNLYAINVEDGSVRQLIADLPVGGFTWSPDGQRLVFLSSRDTGEQRIETLYLLEADGSHLRRLTGDYGGISWSWSPDGRQLAFTCFEEDYRSPQRHGKLHLMDLERETIRQVTEDTAYPAWSHETNELAFLWSYDAHHLFRMDADGMNRQVLFHTDLVVSPYGWSPDSKLLACYLWSRSHWGAGYEDSDSFHVFDAQGNLVFQEAWGASSLAWSPDSRHIACIAPFEYYEDEEDQEQDFVESHDYLYLLARDGSSVQALAPTAYEVGIGWSPDSQRIAFILDDDDRYALGVVDLVSQELRSYPMEGEDNTAYGVRPTTPAWSPDSQQIAYSSLDSEHLLLIGMNETTPRSLTRTLWHPSHQEIQEQGNEMVERSFISQFAWQPSMQKGGDWHWSWHASGKRGLSLWPLPFEGNSALMRILFCDEWFILTITVLSFSAILLRNLWEIEIQARRYHEDTIQATQNALRGLLVQECKVSPYCTKRSGVVNSYPLLRPVNSRSRS